MLFRGHSCLACWVKFQQKTSEIFFLFSQKIGFDILCKLSPETICIKCQSQISEKYKKNMISLSSAEVVQREVTVKYIVKQMIQVPLNFDSLLQAKFVGYCLFHSFYQSHFLCVSREVIKSRHTIIAKWINLPDTLIDLDAPLMANSADDKLTLFFPRK